MIMTQSDETDPPFDYNAGFEDDQYVDHFSGPSSTTISETCSSLFASDTDTPATCFYIICTILFVEFFIDVYIYVVQYKDRNRLNQIEDQITILKEKEKDLHGIDNFTKRAKIQRTINALEKDSKPLKALLDDSLMSAFTSTSTSTITTFLFKKGWKYFSQPLLIGCIALFYWGKPLLYFPLTWFYPFTLLNFLINQSDGAISAVAWSIICYRALKKIIHGLFI